MAAHGGQAGEGGDDAELARRLDRLSRDLKAEGRDRASPDEPRRQSTASGYAAAVRMGSEFIAGVVVGAALGWGLDRLAGTSPWGLIGFLLLGFVAGVVNVVRSAGRTGSPPA